MLGLRRFLAVLGAWALSLGLGAKPACAQEYSELEQRTVLRALGPAPDRELEAEGKRIESVRIVRF